VRVDDEGGVDGAGQVGVAAPGKRPRRAGRGAVHNLARAEERALRVDRNEGVERARLLDDRPAPGVVGLGDIVNVAGRGRRHSVGQAAAARPGPWRAPREGVTARPVARAGGGQRQRLRVGCMGRGLSQGLSHTQRPELQTPLREQSLWQAASPAANAAAPRRSASIASAAAAADERGAAVLRATLCAPS
jgi:hypothetical protein